MKNKTPQPNSLRGGWMGHLPAAGIIAVAAILMLFSARGDLWFDEILSLQWATNAKNPGEIVVLYRHDNNHPLNTLWLHVLGRGASPMLYRSLAIASGIASLMLLYYLALRIVPPARFHVLLLAAGSYSFLLYFSEARGYGPAIACTLGAFAILVHCKFRPHRAWTPLFWLTAVAGILSHATVLYPLAALGVWTLWCERSQKTPWRSVLLGFSWWFAIPAAFAVGFYLLFLKPMLVAGGPEYSLLRVASEFFAYGLGLPQPVQWAIPILLLSLALVVTALALGSFTLPGTRLLCILAAFVFPALGLLASGAEYLYFRYFLVGLPFVMLLLGGLLARMMLQGRAGQIAAAVLIVSLLVVQAPRTLALAQTGRGQYTAALTYVADSSPGDIHLVSDHDMLVGMVAEHLRTRNPAFARIRYHPSWVEPPQRIDWVALHRQDTQDAPHEEILVHGRHFQFAKEFPSAPVSGAAWILYSATTTNIP